MRKRAVRRREVWAELLFRQNALFAVPFGLLGTYDLVRAQMCNEPCTWPVMIDFMPWWGWLLAASVVLIFVVLEGAYRRIQALQPPLLSDARHILQERINSGQELQWKATEMKREEAESWFEDAMTDLEEVVGESARKRFENNLPIATAYSSGAGNYNHRHLVRNTKVKLEELVDGLSDVDLYIAESDGGEHGAR